MKDIFLIISVMIIGFIPFKSISQDTCIVLKKELLGIYEGKCKNGLAHGQGIAKGKDWYQGRFRKGLPDGYGKYVWMTGEIYEGFWKKGKMNGEGTYSFKSNDRDSVYEGLWRMGEFIKIIEESPYIILKSNSITRYTVKRIGNGNRVFFVFMRGGEVNNFIYNLHFAENGGVYTKLGDRQGFEMVGFPFTCNIVFMSMNYFQTGFINIEFEIQINKSGEWLITLYN